MWGDHMGALKVYVSHSDSTKLVASRNGDQGDSWKEDVIDLTTYAGKIITITIEGNTGSDYKGDMALDNISITGQKLITSANNYFLSNLTLFPNPAENSINLSNTNPLFYEVYDISGKVTTSGVCRGGIDISQLTNGLYHVVFRDETGVFRSSFIKK